MKIKPAVKNTVKELVRETLKATLTALFVLAILLLSIYLMTNYPGATVLTIVLLTTVIAFLLWVMQVYDKHKYDKD
jgi:flagellar biosynthesis component FlhA